MITRKFITIHLTPRRWAIAFLLHHDGKPFASWAIYSHKKYTSEAEALEALREYEASEAKAAAAREGSKS